MLVLDKGNFLGELSGFYPAGDFAAGITAYYRDKPISVMHSHEESHISFRTYPKAGPFLLCDDPIFAPGLIVRH